MRETPKAQLVAYAVAAVLLVVAGARYLQTRDEPKASPQIALDGGAGGAEAGSADPGRAEGGRLYVHVAGAVRRPGLYRVPEAARVAAAIDRAGGPSRRADLTGVNLAATLEDGQQIVVPQRGAATGATAAAGSGSAGAAGGSPAPVSLASATLEQLDAIDGIGPTLAERIIEYRDAHGGFRSVDELQEVDGIGEKRFAALRDAVAP